MRVAFALVLTVLYSALGRGAALAAAGEDEIPAESRVAVLTSADEGDISVRLRDELGAVGFSAVLATAPPTEPSANELQRLAESLEVAAAIAVYAQQEALTIWVVDRVTGKVVYRSTPMPADDGDRVRLVALRAVELLRASFRELEQDRSPPGQEVEPAPAARALLRPATPRFGFDVGPAIAGAPGGLGPTAHVMAGVRWFLRPRWSLALRGVVPTTPGRIDDEEGFARVTIGLVDVGAYVGLRPVTTRVQPEVGAAVGLAVLRMDGVARAPAQGNTDHVLTSSVRLQAGLAVAVHPRLRLRIDGSVGVLAPRPAVVFIDREVGTWGRPYGLGGLSVEVVFD